jgi:hypothetical protein
MKVLAYKKSWRIKNSSTKMPTLSSTTRDPHPPDERQHDGQEPQKWVDRLLDAIVAKLKFLETNELKIKHVRQHSIIHHRFL